MDVLNRMLRCGIVPVVVLDNAADAVPTARALLAGGVDVMEITFRTAAAADAIRAVAEQCPDMLVGAGIRRVVIRNTETEFTVLPVQDWIDEDDTLELE